jgi:hypothetical protein
MKVLIEGRFSSAEETADVLGVSSSRASELVSLARSNSPYLARVGAKRKTSSKKRTPSASRKRRARGKTAKARR